MLTAAYCRLTSHSPSSIHARRSLACDATFSTAGGTPISGLYLLFFAFAALQNSSHASRFFSNLPRLRCTCAYSIAFCCAGNSLKLVRLTVIGVLRKERDEIPEAVDIIVRSSDQLRAALQDLIAKKKRHRLSVTRCTPHFLCCPRLRTGWPYV